MADTIRVIDIVEDTMVDGPGLRTSVYCAGCNHQCAECHNKQSWDFCAGLEMTVDDIMKRINANHFDDVTFSGGDPMYQPQGFTALAKRIKQTTCKSIWCYTGFRYEQLIQHPAQKELLELVDVLVDGPYIAGLRDVQLLFRGSKNQRIIDVKQSLEQEKIILWHR